MSTFDERENAFESKFAHDAEMQFKADARRDKLLGLWAAALTMYQNDGKIRAIRIININQFGNALTRHCAFFNQPCIVQSASGGQRAAHSRKVTPGFHNDQRIGPGHMADQIIFWQRSHQNCHHIVAPREGRIQRIPAADHTGDRG